MQSRYFDCDDSDTFSEHSFTGNELGEYNQYLSQQEVAHAATSDNGASGSMESREPASKSHTLAGEKVEPAVLPPVGVATSSSAAVSLSPPNIADIIISSTADSIAIGDNLSNCESLSDLSTDDSERDKALT